MYLIVDVVLVNMVSVKGELQVRPNSINMNRLQLSGSETSLLVVRERHIPRHHITLSAVQKKHPNEMSLSVIYLITLYVDNDLNRAVMFRVSSPQSVETMSLLGRTGLRQSISNVELDLGWDQVLMGQ